MNRVLLCVLVCCIIVYTLISIKEWYICVQNYVGYNQLCDINECRNLCEPNKYECSLATNRCEYKVPQPDDQVCRFDDECKSRKCYFDASGKNTGVGVCRSKGKKGETCGKHADCKSNMCANISENDRVGVCI